MRSRRYVPRKEVNMKGKKIASFVLIYFISGIVFLLLTLPFQKILSVFTVTEVRPSAVLYPFLGISFGWPAALGIMTANFICDYLKGFSNAILYEGIIFQLIYTMVPCMLWRHLTQDEPHVHRLDSVGRVLKYVLVCFDFSLLSALGVGLILLMNYHVNPVEVAFFVLGNNFLMSVILGCPLMVAANQILSRRSGTERILSKNEIIILITAAVQLLLMLVTTVTIYKRGQTIATYDIWNTIYVIGSITIAVTMPLSLCCMVYFEKRKSNSPHIRVNIK